jgi:hypothetical protein
VDTIGRQSAPRNVKRWKQGFRHGRAAWTYDCRGSGSDQLFYEQSGVAARHASEVNGRKREMAKKSNGKLLEVAVIERDPTSWEWQVEYNGRILVCGFEKTKLEARFAGNDAMFLILASGRDL